ncbi:MAG TPA: prevent-host-death protein [Firmicutes bacterium]|jgi:prevent-host-death family protein|nr:prevent-host-death protein [Bacillota bacterium]HBL50201.1 prevent-host-death protein [Bacillota bacterium]HBL68548.1 prevent-host-death protein [Bacillota bacterium]HCF89321.1 prevent-host-death protein [Bacillota bacterium]HCF92718.1 prevent-host-death protein [Bacillota bacterium]
MKVNATDLQNAFGKYLALTEKEDIIVTRNGKSVAKLTRYTEPDFYVVQEEARGYQAQRKISYEEYMELVESSDQRYELIDGVVYLLASPSFKHQIVVSEIAYRFYSFFKNKRCRSLTAPLDVRLFGFATKFEEDPNVVQPDLVVICDSDKVNAAEDKYMGTPTLIVEVLSPSTRGKDQATKLNLYMRSGISEYWVVDFHRKTVSQYTFTAERDFDNTLTLQEGDTIISNAFAGLEIALAEIFASV